MEPTWKTASSRFIPPQTDLRKRKLLLSCGLTPVSRSISKRTKDSLKFSSATRNNQDVMSRFIKLREEFILSIEMDTPTSQEHSNMLLLTLRVWVSLLSFSQLRMDPLFKKLSHLHSRLTLLDSNEFIYLLLLYLFLIIIFTNMIKRSLFAIRSLRLLNARGFLETKLTEDKLKELKLEYRISPSL